MTVALTDVNVLTVNSAGEITVLQTSGNLVVCDSNLARPCIDLINKDFLSSTGSVDCKISHFQFSKL
jgi:hypothetical protein